MKEKTIYDYPMFKIAELTASLSPFEHRFRMGAVISKKGIPLAFGFNKLKTHAEFPNAFSIHAEMAALLRLRNTKNADGAIIWIYRQTADGYSGMAKPCGLCLPLIVEAGIKKIYYSTNIYPYYEVIWL